MDKKLDIQEFDLSVPMSVGDIFEFKHYAGKPVMFVLIGHSHLGFSFIELEKFIDVSKTFDALAERSAWYDPDIAGWLKSGEVKYIGNIFTPVDALLERCKKLKKELELD